MIAPTATPDSAIVSAIQHALLAWYAQHGRDLPWRHTYDPYRILVAEVMLQQTQVERVLPKYAEFLEAFPTLADLARAPRGEVIRRWAPLGYNRRAVRLHEIAQQVTVALSGQFPSSIEHLLKLKGVGRYTAGALACFAFRQPVAFLDTNIRRVLGRCLAGIPFPTPGQDAQLLALAEQALAGDAAYAWHQALMDLGATVCTRARPACPRCPLREHCQARTALADEAPSEGVRMVAEKPPPYRVQPKFAGSTRYYRGRIVAVLRELKSGEALDLLALGRAAKPGFGDDDLGWLAGLVEGLAADGLISVEKAGELPTRWQVALP